MAQLGTRRHASWTQLVVHDGTGVTWDVMGERAGQCVTQRIKCSMPRRERVKIAGEAGGVDERTVAKVLLGEPVRGDAGKRIANVLRARGLDVPTPGQSDNIQPIVEGGPCR